MVESFLAVSDRRNVTDSCIFPHFGIGSFLKNNIKYLNYVETAVSCAKVMQLFLI